MLDIDAHHGNGTQAIFYARPDVYYGSVHVDPAAGWFPHYMGFANERGNAAGTGANRNVPLAPGSGDDAWLEAVGLLCDDVRAYGAAGNRALARRGRRRRRPGEPASGQCRAYRAAGEMIGSLGPVAAVQEGGYDLASLGEYVLATLTGVAAGRAAAST